MSSSPPRISVALCTHNGVPYIAEQLRSILHQSLPPSQLVVSDDASSDGTVALVREIIARFRAERPGSVLKFTLLQNPVALGVVKNFERAVQECSGELIALCDQDDVWQPHRLETVARVFAQRPELTLLHSDAQLVDAGGKPLQHTLFEAIGFSAAERLAVHEGRAFDALLRRNLVTGATTVFRRELLDLALPFEPAWVHDEWLAIVASLTGRVDFLPDPLVDYRQHGANAIGASKPTLGQKVSRLQEPRTVRNERLLQRAAALERRLDGFGALGAGNDRARSLAAGKLRHERMRSALPAVRLFRVPRVLWAALLGDYSRFGRARYDVARDLLQPVSPKGDG